MKRDGKGALQLARDRFSRLAPAGDIVACDDPTGPVAPRGVDPDLAQNSTQDAADAGSTLSRIAATPGSASPSPNAARQRNPMLHVTFFTVAMMLCVVSLPAIEAEGPTLSATPPGPPQFLTAKAQPAAEVDLRWQPPSDDGGAPAPPANVAVLPSHPGIPSTATGALGQTPGADIAQRKYDLQVSIRYDQAHLHRRLGPGLVNYWEPVDPGNPADVQWWIDNAGATTVDVHLRVFAAGPPDDAPATVPDVVLNFHVPFVGQQLAAVLKTANL